MSDLNSKWYNGLRAELTEEIKKAVRMKTAKGNKDWGVVVPAEQKREARKSVVSPIFPMFAREDEKGGRSLAYHASVAEEMITRHELGMSLWSDDEADTSETDVEDLRLTSVHFQVIERMMTIANETTLESLRK